MSDPQMSPKDDNNDAQKQLEANTQLNNLTFTGHDSVVADHGSTASHDASS